MNSAATRVFLSYRREDTRHVAGRLGDRLTEQFGQVFMDIDNIEPGMDFTDVIRRAVGECDVLLAVIGTHWTAAVDGQGRRRLDDPDDWMVREIQVALDRDIRVIPVLVDGAQMPTRRDLPPPLASLASRQAVLIRFESFSSDASRLIRAIERTFDLERRPPEPPVGVEAEEPSIVEPPLGVEAEEPLIGDIYDDANYIAALTEFFAERWDQAVALLTLVVKHHSDDPRVVGRLTEAVRHQQLSSSDNRALQAVEQTRWADAVKELETILTIDPSYRDVAARLEMARGQLRLQSLHADFRGLHAASKWAAAIAAANEIAQLEPGFTDSEGLVADARAKLREAGLADRYATGLRQLDQGSWEQATATFKALQRESPDYRDTVLLLSRAANHGTAPSHATVDTSALQTIQVGQRVESLTFSPEGFRLATGSADQWTIWDLRTGAAMCKKRYEYEQNSNPRRVRDHRLWGLAFSPDGNRIAIASTGFAQIVDSTTGDQRLKVAGSWSYEILAVAFSPDGDRLATASNDLTARIWDTATGRQRLQVAHTDSVLAVEFSPDGTLLATGGCDRSARIWDAATGRQILQIKHRDLVRAVAFSSDGVFLATAGNGNYVQIWDLSVGAKRNRWSRESQAEMLRLDVNHGDLVQDVIFSPDGTRLATRSLGSARIWNSSTGRPEMEVTHAPDPVLAIAFSPDGTRIATGSHLTARIWDTSGS